MKKKRMLMYLLSAAAVLCMTACGSGGSPAGSGNGSQTESGETGSGDRNQTGNGDGALPGSENDGESKPQELEESGETMTEETDYIVDYEGIATAKIEAGVSVHDPSVYKADGKYYIFGSHMSTAVSEDLRHWTSIGDGYKNNNPVYQGLLENRDAFAYAGWIVLILAELSVE